MAREGSLELEIVTPQGVMLQTRVDEVVAPSVEGEFGVLPGHLPVLATLQVGLLHYKEGDQSTDVAVGTGFAEVVNDKALILTDRFATRDEVEVLTVRERLTEVDEQLETWDGELDDPARLGLIEEEQWLAAQLELYGDPPVPKVLEQTRALDYRAIIPDADGSEAAAADEETAPDE